MRNLILFILTLTSISCTTRTSSVKEVKTTTTQTDKREFPADGKYRYDILFTEWNGKSMGEKVTVIIKGDYIQVIYEGDGKLSAKKGDILESGKIRKHKSGKWIIIKNENDINLDEVGGCADGPAVIDFKNNKFWMC